MCEGCFFVSHGSFFLSRKFLLFHTELFFSLTELTECTEFFRQRLKDRWFTLRVPSGFELSPTDCTDNSDFNSSFSSMRSLAAQKLLPSVVIIASFGIVQASLTLPSLIARSRSTDDTDFTPSEFFSPTNLTNFTNLYPSDLFSSHKSHKFLQFALCVNFC